MQCRVFVSLICAFERGAISLRPRCLRKDIADFGDDLSAIPRSIGVGVDCDAPPTVLAKYLIGAVRLFDTGNTPERYMTGRRIDEKIGQPCRGSVDIG